MNSAIIPVNLLLSMLRLLSFQRRRGFSSKPNLLTSIASNTKEVVPNNGFIYIIATHLLNIINIRDKFKVLY